MRASGHPFGCIGKWQVGLKRNHSLPACVPPSGLFLLLHWHGLRNCLALRPDDCKTYLAAIVASAKLQAAESHQTPTSHLFDSSGLTSAPPKISARFSRSNPSTTTLPRELQFNSQHRLTIIKILLASGCGEGSRKDDGRRTRGPAGGPHSRDRVFRGKR